MRLLLLIFIGIITLQFNAVAQDMPKESVAELMAGIRKSKPDSNRIVLQLKLGSYYLFKPGSYRNDMDSTIRYYNQALALSTKLHDDLWKYRTLELIGNYEVENGNPEKGITTIKQIIPFYHQHNLVYEAVSWERLGGLLNDDVNRPEQLVCYKKADSIYTRFQRNDDELRVLLSVAYINFRLGNLDAAEHYYMQGLLKISKKPNAHLEDFEFQIALVYNVKAMYHRALYYQLKLIGNPSAKSNDHTAGYWQQAAATYYLLGMYDEALRCNNKAEEGVNPQNINGQYVCMAAKVLDLLALNKPQVALSCVMQIIKRTPPADDFQKSVVLKSLGLCYAALKQDKLAAKYWDELMNTLKQTYQNKPLDAFSIDRYVLGICQAVKFFTNTFQYKKAFEYFDLIKPFIDKQVVYLPSKLRILPIVIKLDSVSGNYKKAFDDLSLYKKISDSVYNSTKSQQIAEMQTRFESSQKEHAIKLLQSQSKAQNLEIQSAQIERNVTFAGIGILLLLAGLGYNRYRFKQRANIQLEAKQQEINSKNESLERLLGDKDQLLTEKDWLIKEVHHRVKNNLQTVLSLLESQASYLKDDALNAIRTSQHRIYAMSLIHQKLYQDNNLATIDIALYLHEFIESLKESFGTEGNIKFNLDLQPIDISAAQAIPVALIVNEAVTNAIKYAFPDLRKGEIWIAIKESDGRITLTITDNGIGIDPELIHKELNSMGIALIKGLTTELKGKLKIESINGTAISLVFNRDKLLKLPEDFSTTT